MVRAPAGLVVSAAVMIFAFSCTAEERVAPPTPEPSASPTEPPTARPKRSPGPPEPKSSHTRADFDGDGDVDSVRLKGDRCRTNKGNPQCAYSVHVLLNGAGMRSFPFNQCRFYGCAITGPSDFDGDGRSELVVSQGPGAAINLWGIYRVGPYGLDYLGVTNWLGPLDPPYSLFGGSHDSIAESGFWCRDRPAGRRVVAYQATRRRSSAKAEWRAHITVFRLVGDVFFQVGERIRRLPGRFPIPRPKLCP